MLDILHSEEKACELNRIMTHCLAGFSGGSLLVSHVSVQQSQGLKPHLILNSQISLPKAHVDGSRKRINFLFVFYIIKLHLKKCQYIFPCVLFNFLRKIYNYLLRFYPYRAVFT